MNFFQKILMPLIVSNTVRNDKYFQLTLKEPQHTDILYRISQVINPIFLRFKYI